MTDFLLLAFVFLVAGVVSVPIASRLGLGSVLGYLIAGIVISPITRQCDRLRQIDRQWPQSL